MTFRIVIPARFASERLPGKVLLPVAEQPLLWHVWQRARESAAAEVIIATDDARVRDAASSFGATVCMTGGEHRSGTDRIAEVARRAGWDDEDVVVNLQGDEPLLPAVNIDQVAGLAAQAGAVMATLSWPISDGAEMADPNVVKVVTDQAGDALYFSRAPIPFERSAGAGVAGQRHIGLYAYRVGTLLRLASAAVCALEQTERLEQLRALWMGVPIRVAQAQELPGPGVDTPQDLAVVRGLLAACKEP